MSKSKSCSQHALLTELVRIVTNVPSSKNTSLQWYDIGAPLFGNVLLSRVKLWSGYFR